jgi:large subunit ribosomal protein L15
MTVKKQSKIRKFRGSRTCGWGRRHRGSGCRAGSGSGLGKHADAKKRSFPADYFGKEGFNLINRTHDKIINLRDLDASLDALAQKGVVKKDGSFFVVDLSALGYDKLVGGGIITHKMRLKAKCSANVAEKLKQAGCELN